MDATLGEGFLFPLPLPPSPLFGALPPAGRLSAMSSFSETGGIGSMQRPPYSSTSIGLREKGTLAPGASTTSEADAATHLFRYWNQRHDTSNRSAVAR